MPTPADVLKELASRSSELTTEEKQKKYEYFSG
jgi:hypothetical protein